jgi:WD40 repeat protein
MVEPVATFTPRAPVSLFESAKLSLDTVFQTMIEPNLYAEIDGRNRVTALRNTTAVLTRARVTNTSADPRTVEFRASTLKVGTYQVDVVAQPGENWLRLERVNTASDVPLAIYDWTESPPVRTTDPVASIGNLGLSVSWTPDSRYLASASVANRFRIFDAENAFATVYTSIASPAPVQPSIVRWSPSGRYLAVTYRNVTEDSSHPFLRVFDFDDKTAPVEVSIPGLSTISDREILHMEWGGPTGRYLVFGPGNGVRQIAALDWNTGSPVSASALSETLSENVSGLRGIAISPDDPLATPRCRIAIASSRTPRLRVWSFTGATTISRVNNAVLAENTAQIVGDRGLAWSADGRYLASLSGESTSVPFTVFDFSAGVTVRTPPQPLPALPPLRNVTWSPDGRYLFIGHLEATRYSYYPQQLRYQLLYDYSSGSPVRIFNSPRLQGSGRMTDARWSPDGAFLAVSQFGWDPFYPPTGVDNVRLIDDEGTDFVVNGSFEDMTGATAEPFGFVATNTVPGWFSDQPGNTTLFFPTGRFVDARPTDGSVYLDLVARSTAIPIGNSAQLRQNFNDLVAGETYRLSADVTASRESAVGVQIVWNGNPLTIDGSASLPLTQNRPILRVTLQPGESANLDLGKHMLVYGDQLQAKASGGGVSAVVSYIRSTQEQVPSGGPPVEMDEGEGV